MKKIETDVLALLKDDSRLTVAAMANMLGQNEKVIAETVERLEKKGVIVKYTVISDDEKAESEIVEALIEVRVSPTCKNGFDSIAEEISQHDEVKSVYLMSGAYDLVIIIEGKTLKEIAMFVSEKLSGIDKVLSTATHFILKKYKLSGVRMSADSASRQAIHP